MCVLCVGENWRKSICPHVHFILNVTKTSLRLVMYDVLLMIYKIHVGIGFTHKYSGQKYFIGTRKLSGRMFALFVLRGGHVDMSCGSFNCP